MESARPRSSGFLAPRRVFTAPVPPSPQSAGGLVDTLYDHPNVKIVSFTAGASSLFVGQGAAAGPDIEPGSLSWSSQLERTIAVGPFRIYRAPGSVAFLSCGSALQPILPKSQAWCVDEESSKFVLQIRRPQYWRIEVPVEEQEDVRRAHQLRDVFDTILQFEKTECPFQRSFTVELPERPQTPVKKRPWTPARRSSASLPLTPATPVEVARLHEGTPRGSICMGDLRTALDARRSLNEHARNLEAPTEEPVLRESGNWGASLRPTAPIERPRSVSAAPPQRLPLIAVPLPKIRETGPADLPAEAPSFTSPTESLESVHGRESWLPTPLPPSPPLSTPGSPRSSSHLLQVQNVPEIANPHHEPSHTITSKPSQTWSVATAESLAESQCSTTTAPSSVHDPEYSPACAQQPADTTQPTPTPAKDEPETPLKTASSSPTQTSPSPRGRRPPIRRATTTTTTTTSSSISPSRRALSPLPPTANLLTTTTPHQRTPSPITAAAAAGARPKPGSRSSSSMAAATAQGALAAVRRLPMTVLHKTCEILMSPPSHLISLMLKVAARITAGEWRGLVFGMGEGGERVSVTWDWSDDDEDHRRRRRGTHRGRGGNDVWVEGFEFDGRRGGGGGVDDFWRGPRRTGRVRMVGAFPESDDDEDEDDEEEVGPLDRPRSRAEAEAVSPRRNDGEVSTAQGKAPAIDGKEAAEPGKDADTEWSVD
ncbi:inheritance of peroxisomes protein 1-domain-containing protein [Parachaetomium inaequale]|uniref:Inheritance of peroxisomes protein 1 n=1 Tax=Parachaetomium inaequale TaxID=2588326 RepID=A0AAN6SL36_9PEZI|nr:inheritance of peroxisomes protein 1-domain-containing protein [Parachaetomium inaequale]